MRRRRTNAVLAGLTALTLGACATDGYYGHPGYSPYGGYAYDGSSWGGPRRPYSGPLRGPGLQILDPWLVDTEEGRAIVTLGWNEAGNGFVSEEVAHRANIWFRRYADEDCDMRITDAEIRTALVAGAGRYLR